MNKIAMLLLLLVSSLNAEIIDFSDATGVSAGGDFYKQGDYKVTLSNAADGQFKTTIANTNLFLEQSAAKFAVLERLGGMSFALNDFEFYSVNSSKKSTLKVQGFTQGDNGLFISFDVEKELFGSNAAGLKASDVFTSDVFGDVVKIKFTFTSASTGHGRLMNIDVSPDSIATATPVPSSLALMFLGLLGIASARRRRK
ncbi:MAG: PEP-CTERM sorting domain-containing protein [Lentisphaeraceae bacterium]|nr:PEP-CTERM sorting domain-containing protein [Lentisphaeraceae bacterium]